uniref:Fibronectin type III-like domain-containing protein n=1 Tax=Strigamia maritima TaxID=126957 RepID=T1IY05_STRMM
MFLVPIFTRLSISLETSVHIKRCISVAGRTQFAKKNLPFVYEPPEKKLQIFNSGDTKELTPLDPTRPILKYAELVDELNVSPGVRRLVSLGFSRPKETLRIHKHELMKPIQKHILDTGSYESQIAALTADIKWWQKYLTNGNLQNSRVRVSLNAAIDRRFKILKKLRMKDYKRFEWVIETLGIKYRQAPMFFHWATRKGTLRVMTREYCNKMRRNKIEAYKAKLKGMQDDFLKEKEETLDWIKKEKEELGIKDEDIEKDNRANKMKITFAFFFMPFFCCFFTDAFPFRNISLPWHLRVEDLVSRLTLEEIVLQLSQGGRSPGGGPAPPIERLGISPWVWNTECLHGVVRNGRATSFPHAIGLAATFNRKLAYEMAETIAAEVRAKNSDYTARGLHGNDMGINCFSPVVNVMRHPLWGRNQETFGEDPYLIGEISKRFAKGLQGNHPRYLRTSATCKHFAAHNGPEDKPVSRYVFDAHVSERDMQLTYLPQFQTCVVEGEVLSVMCSYNRLNGVPACVNNRLLKGILRNEWNFNGFIIADQDALENIVDTHKWKNTYEEAAAAALLAGVNLGLTSGNPKSVFTYLPRALQAHMVEVSDIVNAVKPLFYTRMRLGEFDPPKLNPYTKYPLSVIQSDQHREVSSRVAAQSFVLLKNKNNVLPLEKSIYDDIAILGPLADNYDDLFGSVSPQPNPKYVQTPLKGLISLAHNVHYKNGCRDGSLCTDYDHEGVKNMLKSAKNQFIVVCLGTGGAPIILVLFNGGPINSELFESVDAIFECFFPGQETGVALRNILLNQGPHSNPAGRLPFTWMKSLDQVGKMTNYAMENFTYRYWNQRPVNFPFGYGLSYTNFKYSNLHVKNQHIHANDDVTFSVNIRNVGDKNGEEVVQAYISWHSSPEPMPRIQLVGFDRVFIATGKSYTWRQTIKPRQLAVYLDNKGFRMVPGEIDLYVGGQQPNQTVSASSNVLTVTISVLKSGVRWKKFKKVPRTPC